MWGYAGLYRVIGGVIWGYRGHFKSGTPKFKFYSQSPPALGGEPKAEKGGLPPPACLLQLQLQPAAPLLQRGLQSCYLCNSATCSSSSGGAPCYWAATGALQLGALVYHLPPSLLPLPLGYTLPPCVWCSTPSGSWGLSGTKIGTLFPPTSEHNSHALRAPETAKCGTNGSGGVITLVTLRSSISAHLCTSF
jgi:hypothetical protein